MGRKRYVYNEPLVMLATFIRWYVLATITGIIVGASTSLFLHILLYLTGKTEHISFWTQMVMLPIGGLITGLLIHYGAPDAAGHGTEAVISAVHDKHGQISAKVAPIKTLATVITLTSGGSAGKEGPCAQIGGAMAAAFANLVRLSPLDRKRLVICGISAGFASVFGTPIAGTIFGIEVLAIGGLMYDMMLPSFVAGVTSYEVSKFLGIPYTSYTFSHQVPFTETIFVKMIVIGIMCGLISWLAIEIFEWNQYIFHSLQKRITWKPALPMVGGIVLSILILFIPTDYLGLSIPLLNTALEGHHVAFLAFFWKILFVSITLASGFSGGIITPLFVIGATAGSTLSHIFNVDPSLGSAVGMMAIVAACSNTPISAIIMGMELFGSDVGIYVLTASVTAYIIVGHRSVYPSQIVSTRKSSWMHVDTNIALEHEKHIHVSYGLIRGIKRMVPKR